jgi:hypothetical protein
VLIFQYSPTWIRTGEAVVRGPRELLRVPLVRTVVGRDRNAGERVHPARQVVEVLAVPLPLEPFVDGLPGSALRERLADAESSRGRVPLALGLREAADPSAAAIVRSKTPERVVHPADQLERELQGIAVSRTPIEREVVADRVRIGP